MKICNFRAHYSSPMLSYVIIFMVEKMNYIKINLKLNNPLAFWANFSESERFFWFDPQKETFVIGCERLKAIDLEHDKFSDYPYLFHSQTFLMTLKENFGKISVAKPLLLNIISLSIRKILTPSLVIAHEKFLKSLFQNLSINSLKKLLIFRLGKNFFMPFKKFC